MSTTEDFRKHFAGLSDGRLLEVVQDAKDRDPAAVVAAQEELDRRGLSVVEREALEQHVAMRLAAKSQADHRVRNLLMDGKGMMQDVLRMTAERWHLWLAVCLLPPLFKALPAMHELTRYLSMPGFMHAGLIEEYMPLVLLPMCMYWIWRRLPRGWYGGAAFAIHQVFGALLALAHAVLEAIINSMLSFFPAGTGTGCQEVVSTMVADGQGVVEWQPTGGFPWLSPPPDYNALLMSFLGSGVLVALFFLERSLREFALPSIARLRAVGLGFGLWMLLNVLPLFLL